MFEAIILGIVQGLTEFLPVSSTAHLIIFPWFFNWTGELDSLTFDVALHAGTLLSLLLCFWKDWIDIFVRRRRLLGLLIMASFPAGLAGIFLNDLIEDTLRSPVIICLSLVGFGFFMLASEKMQKNRKLDDLGPMDALMIGISQAVALIPGVSRSGITISTGLFMNLTREEAARFSFLLSTPVIGGAVLLHARKMMTDGAVHDLRLFAVGFAASAITGYIAIKFLLSFLRKHPVDIFVYYRFILAAVIITGVWLKG